jgi:carbonic anhydrase
MMMRESNDCQPACCCHSEQPNDSTATTLSRRRLLGATLAGAAASAVTGTEFLLPSAAHAQTVKTPAEALKALVDGNQRFLDRKLTFYEEDLEILQQNTAEKQEPFASILSCADSRVPVELIFDQSIGHVFVNRVAGNIATTEIIASIEYGAVVLGTKVIMVLGHGNCGAVAATIAGKAVPGQISSLYRYIRPAVNAAGEDLRAATEANAKLQAQLLREASPALAELIKKGELSVVAAYFDVASGKVTVL